MIEIAKHNLIYFGFSFSNRSVWMYNTFDNGKLRLTKGTQFIHDERRVGILYFNKEENSVW
jgi:hypothetical protein